MQKRQLFARNENIGKIRRRTITWTNFSMNTWNFSWNMDINESVLCYSRKYFNPLWVAKSVFHKQLFPDRTDNFSTLVFLKWHLRIYLVFREKEKKIIAKVSLLSTVLIVKTLCAKPTKYVFWNRIEKEICSLNRKSKIFHSFRCFHDLLIPWLFIPWYFFIFLSLCLKHLILLTSKRY